MICSLATVTGIAYELLPKIDFSLDIKDRALKIVNDLDNMGVRLSLIDYVPRNGIVVISVDLPQIFVSHARPILKYKEIYIGDESGEISLDKLVSYSLSEKTYLKVIKMRKKRELSEAEKFYIENHKNESLENLARATNQSIKLVQEYLESLSRETEAPKSKDFFIRGKDKSKYLAMTPTASQMGDDFKKSHVPDRYKNGIFEIPQK